MRCSASPDLDRNPFKERRNLASHCSQAFDVTDSKALAEPFNSWDNWTAQAWCF